METEIKYILYIYHTTIQDILEKPKGKNQKKNKSNKVFK